MTIGIGGSTAEKQLSVLIPYDDKQKGISIDEFQQRILKAQEIMRHKNISAMYLNAGTNLYYFTGTKWHASERMVGEILPTEGNLEYIALYIEIGTLIEKGYNQKDIYKILGGNILRV